MSRRRCCCGGKQPCIGSDCCSCESDVGSISPGPYTLDLKTVTTDLWTFGEPKRDYQTCLNGCGLGATNSYPQYELKCVEYNGGPLLLAAGISNGCGICDASVEGQWHRTTKITASTIFNATWANCTSVNWSDIPAVVDVVGAEGHESTPGVIRLNRPYAETPGVRDPATVSFNIRFCRTHPCITWVPDEYSSAEPMCSDCSGAWDIIQVFYVIRDRSGPIDYPSSVGTSSECETASYTPSQFFDTWFATVWYVRKPICVESGGRDIKGDYKFACAIVFLPTTASWWLPCFDVNACIPQDNTGLDLLFQELNCGRYPPNFCYGKAVKLCERIGYGYEFPEFVSLT